MHRSITGHRVLLAALAVLVSAWLLLSPEVSRAEAAGRSIPVKMGDYRFSPERITVNTGETVQLELTNTDALTPHNFTLQAEQAGLAVDVDVSAGKTKVVDITPLVPGSYSFFCNKKLPFTRSHRDRGMQGTLVVGPAE